MNNSKTNTKLGLPIWKDAKGEPVSCVEKVKVLRENHQDLQQQLQDCFEDALLMGCDEVQFKQVLTDLVNCLDNPYQDVN